MSSTIERNRPFLELLATSKSEDQKQRLLETATPGQVRSLGEVLINLCRNRFDLSDNEKDNLREHSKSLVNIASGQVPFKSKQKLLVSKFA